MRTDMIKNGLIEAELENTYKQALRLRKKIDNNLKRLPSEKSIHIKDKAIENLDRLSKCSIEYKITRKMHEVGYASDMPTQDLINILQSGNKYMKPRPFLDLFKKKLRVEFPSAKDMNTLDFAVIKKNIEDDIDSQFAYSMAYNTLNLAPLKYRNGTPLVRSGKLIRGIRWKVVENAN